MRTQIEAALLQARALVAQLEAALGMESQPAPHPICPACASDRVKELEPGPNERWRVKCSDCSAISVDTMEGI